MVATVTLDVALTDTETEGIQLHVKTTSEQLGIVTERRGGREDQQ